MESNAGVLLLSLRLWGCETRCPTLHPSLNSEEGLWEVSHVRLPLGFDARARLGWCIQRRGQHRVEMCRDCPERGVQRGQPISPVGSSRRKRRETAQCSLPAWKPTPWDCWSKLGGRERGRHGTSACREARG